MAQALPHAAFARGWRMLLGALILAAPFLLGGCLIQSNIQGRYVEDRAECRSAAESEIGKYEKTAATKKDRDAQLVTLFSNCMAKKGWQVAKPKKTQVTTNGPHGPLDPYGRGGYGTASGVATSSAKTAAPTQAPVGQQPVQPATQAPVGQAPVPTQSTVLSPGGGQAPLNPPAPNAPAAYQPARPAYTPTPTYGSGAGRNF